jgi:hypothetical protein
MVGFWEFNITPHDLKRDARTGRADEEGYLDLLVLLFRMQMVQIRVGFSIVALLLYGLRCFLELCVSLTVSQGTAW